MIQPFPALLALALGLALPVTSAESTLRYFHDDAGVASPAGTLPADPDAPGLIRWRTALDSGHSSPLVAGSRIFLTTFREATSELATVAINVADGRVLWRQPVVPDKLEQFHRGTGNPATATPACDGDRVFSFFGSVGLLCYDLTGKLLWHHRMGPFQDEYGAGSSPILYEDLVILNQDHDADNFLIALERETGKVRWKSARPDTVRSYSTPVLWRNGERTDLLVAGSLELAGYDPKTGARRWWHHGLARIVIPMPVPVGDTIYMASWSPGGDSGQRITLPPWSIALEKWDANHDERLARSEIQDREVLDRFFRMDLDHDGLLNSAEWERHADVFRKARNSVLALRPGTTAAGELPATAVQWSHARGVPYVASPVVDGGRFWMVKDGGIVTELEAATGRVLNEERLPGGGNYYASAVAGDGKIFFAGESGRLSVVTNRVRWTVLGSHDFREKIYATPAVDRGRILLRTEQALYSLGTSPTVP